MPIPRERRVQYLRTAANKAAPYLAAVFDRLCVDIAARGETPISSADPWRQRAETPRTLGDYMRSTHREPGEEG